MTNRVQQTSVLSALDGQFVDSVIVNHQRNGGEGLTELPQYVPHTASFQSLRHYLHVHEASRTSAIIANTIHNVCQHKYFERISQLKTAQLALSTVQFFPDAKIPAHTIHFLLLGVNLM
jgi:hypothetical protein